MKPRVFDCPYLDKAVAAYREKVAGLDIKTKDAMRTAELYSMTLSTVQDVETMLGTVKVLESEKDKKRGAATERLDRKARHLNTLLTDAANNKIQVSPLLVQFTQKGMSELGKFESDEDK